ncbi:Uncharacterized conserved protein, DUF1800 family [Dyadobacter koreensis]|uniref:Uncharacterized conserved protein, DUF1800 family n=1 Tax=Dyadobacter koreensis TaxID=408657 RepID=A0A1H6U3P4_9BACT|nr:DUF1800 domain-containing protein [Dyadobacter koreensis]SEI82572.1 Uncharacterized conserved protein, DUF1800 family [Dyadobacter koreensis]
MKDALINRDLLHLYRRARFGGIPEKEISVRRAIAGLFRESDSYMPIQLARAQPDISIMGDSAMPANIEEVKKDRMKRNREEIRELNAAWMAKMAAGENAFRERMALFWHGHFACRVQNSAFVESYLNTIRKNALGSFGDLLMAVSKEPAMLQFLNNQQNRKNKPNENFAREVMELFTLGRGHYSESDIKEGARAFTGWGFDSKGNFQFREKLHDDKEKSFLGKKGNFRGEDVIKILLEQRQTARFITAKLHKEFVSENLDEKRISSLADDFYKSGYDVSKLMHTIFSAGWFYENTSGNMLIKSPVELVIGIQRTLGGAEFIDKEPFLYIQKVLGQVLFYPPNVAGWPGGRNWVDSSGLLFRMQLPDLMAGVAVHKIKAKDSGDVNDQNVKRKGENARINVDWAKWANRFDKIQDEKLPVILSQLLLAVQPKPSVMALIIDKNKDISDRTNHIKRLTLAIMGLPEYQIS